MRDLIGDFQKDWRIIVGRIKQHNDWGLVGPTGYMTITNAIDDTIRLVDKIRELRRIENAPILHKMADTADSLENHLKSFKEAVVGGVFGSKEEALSTFSRQLQRYLKELSGEVEQQIILDNKIIKMVG